MTHPSFLFFHRMTIALTALLILSSCSKPLDETPAPAKNAAHPPTPTETKTEAGAGIANPGDKFVLGANYPWLNYGHDFGVTSSWSHDGVSNAKSRAIIKTDFENLRKNGVNVVRWFVFCDGRASPDFDADGNVTGLDRMFFEDMDAALAIAEEQGIGIMFVLFDYLMAEEAKVDNQVQLGGRAKLITDPVKRRTMIEKALVPMLERYGKNPNIVAWDVMNETEGAMAVTGGLWVTEAVEVNEMEAFVREIVDAIHEHASQPVTMGSSSRGMLEYWKSSNLDFFQFHYYDPMESEYPLATPCSSLDLGKPCIVGELPTKNNKRPLAEYLDIVMQNGYAGAFPWSYRGGDESSGLQGNIGEVGAWATTHRSQLLPVSSPKKPETSEPPAESR